MRRRESALEVARRLGHELPTEDQQRERIDREYPAADTDCGPTSTESRRVHVYRNRPDDDRLRDSLVFCDACGGWYGVPHDGSHCQSGGTAKFLPSQCACAFCRRSVGRRIEGTFGFFTTAKEWQP